MQAPHGLASIDSAIVHNMRAQGIRIGEKTAENAKIALASASNLPESLSFSATGFDEVTRLPRLATVSADLVNALTAPYVRELLSLAQAVLARAPIELAADLAERGAYLIGGGAALSSLDVRLRDTLGIPVHIGENPQNCTARGLSLVIESGEKYDRLLLDSAGKTIA